MATREELIYEINVVANESVKKLSDVVGSAKEVKKAFADANEIIKEFQTTGGQGFVKGEKKLSELGKKVADLPTQLQKVQKAIDFIVQGMDKASRSGNDGLVKTLQNELNILRMVELKIENMQGAIKKDNYTERLKAQQREETQVNRLIDVYNRLQKRIENTVDVGKEMSRLAFKTNGDRSESVIASIEKIIGSRAEGNAAWSKIGENGYNKGYDQYLNRVSQSAVAQAAKISDLTEQYNKLHAAMERRVTGGNAGNISKIAEEQGKLQKLNAELTALTQGSFHPGKYETMSVQAIQSESSAYKSLNAAVAKLNDIRAKEAALINQRGPISNKEIHQLEQQANTARDVIMAYRNLTNGNMPNLMTQFMGTDNRDVAMAKTEARIVELTTKHQDLIRTMRDAEAAGKSMGEALFNANQKAEASIVAELAAYKQSAEVVYNSFKQHKMAAEETARLKERVFYKNDFWGSDKNISANENRKELTDLKNWIETLNKEGKVTKELQDEYNKLAEARVKSITSGKVGSISNWETQTQRMIELSRKLGLTFNEISAVQNLSFAQGQKAANEYGVVTNAVNDLIKVQREEMRIMGSGSKVSADRVRELEERADANRKLIESNKHLIQSEVELSTPFQGKDMSTIIKEAKATAVASWRSYSQQIGDTRKNIEQLYYLYQRNPEAKTIQGFQKQILALKQTSKEYETFQKTISKTGTVYDWFADRVLHHMTWLSSGLALGAVMAIPHETIQSIKELEYALAGIQQVMPKIEHDTQAAQKELSDLVGIAGRYGVEVKEVMEAAKSIGRMYGKGADGNINTNLLTEQATKMAVADAFDVENAYRGLESALSQFNMQSENTNELLVNSNRIIDVWTRTSHSGAASAQDIGHAIEAAGTAAAQAGISFEFFNAMVAAGVRATARSGSEIGQAIKSMMVSMQTAKSQKELEKWGITLTEVGTDGVKRMRNMEDVILEVAQLVTTTDKNTNKLLQTLSGGKYQYSKISAILKNYQEIYKVLGMINDEETVGFTDKQVDIQMKTLQRQLGQLKADMQGVFTDIGEAGLLDFLKDCVHLVDNLVVGIRAMDGPWKTTAETIGKVGVALGTAYLAMKAFSKIENFVLVRKEMYNLALASQKAGNAEVTSATLSARAQAAKNLALQGIIVSEQRVARSTDQASEANAREAETAKMAQFARLQQAGAVDKATEAETRAAAAANAAAGASGKAKNALVGVNAALAAFGGPANMVISLLGILASGYLLFSQMAGEAARKQRELNDAMNEQAGRKIQERQRIRENATNIDNLADSYNKVMDAIDNFEGDRNSKEFKELFGRAESLLTSMTGQFGEANVNTSIVNDRVNKDLLLATQQARYNEATLQLRNSVPSDIESRNETLDAEIADLGGNINQWGKDIEQLRKNIADLTKQIKAGEGDSEDLAMQIATLDSDITQRQEWIANAEKSKKEKEQIRSTNVSTSDNVSQELMNVSPLVGKKTALGVVDEDDEKAAKQAATAQAEIDKAESDEWKGAVRAAENAFNAELNEISRLADMYGMTAELAKRQRLAFQTLISAYRKLGADAPNGITKGTGTVGTNPGISVVQRAGEYEGIPYEYGADTVEVDDQNNVIRGALDCSSFVQRVYGDMNIEGMKLPRQADTQQEFFANNGAFKSADDVSTAQSARAGDLVWMPGDGVEYGHVGIADGRGNMWINDSSTGVHNTPIEGRNVNGYGSLSTLMGYAAGDGSADENLAVKASKAANNMVKQFQDSMLKALQDEIKGYQSEAKRKILSYGDGISNEMKEQINLEALKKEIDATKSSLQHLDKQSVKYRETLDSLAQKTKDYADRKKLNDIALAEKPYNDAISKANREIANRETLYAEQHPQDTESHSYEKMKVEDLKQQIADLKALRDEIDIQMAAEQANVDADLESRMAEIEAKKAEIAEKKDRLAGMAEGSEDYNNLATEINADVSALDGMSQAYQNLYINGNTALQNLQKQHTETGKKIADATKELVNTQDKYSKSIKSAVASTFTDILTGTGKVKDKLRDLAKSIAQMFIQKQLTTLMAKWSHGGHLGYAHGGNIPGYAAGSTIGNSYIKGKGTGKSDDILAYLENKDRFVYLSNGEYVMTADAVKRIGVRNLDKLNYGYADGGALDPIPYVPSISSDVQERTLSKPSGNAYTEQLLAEQNKEMQNQTALMRNMGENGNGDVVVLNTHASSDDVVRAIQENPRVIQTLLGRQKKMGFR